MKRMLKEEKELREGLRKGVSLSKYNALIAALTRAVREECAKVACKTILSFEDAPNLITASERVAAAIRGGNDR